MKILKKIPWIAVTVGLFLKYSKWGKVNSKEISVIVLFPSLFILMTGTLQKLAQTSFL